MLVFAILLPLGDDLGPSAQKKCQAKTILFAEPSQNGILRVFFIHNFTRQPPLRPITMTDLLKESFFVDTTQDERSSILGQSAMPNQFSYFFKLLFLVHFHNIVHPWRCSYAMQLVLTSTKKNWKFSFIIKEKLQPYKRHNIQDENMESNMTLKGT